MTKAVKKAVKKDSPANRPREFRWDTFLIEATSKFGVTGVAVLSLILIFVYYGTEEQKRQFIDKFFLFKVSATDVPYLTLIGLFLVIVFIIQGRVHRKRIQLKDERIEQLEKHVDVLENKLLDNKK